MVGLLVVSGCVFSYGIDAKRSGGLVVIFEKHVSCLGAVPVFQERTPQTLGVGSDPLSNINLRAWDQPHSFESSGPRHEADLAEGRGMIRVAPLA